MLPDRNTLWLVGAIVLGAALLGLASRLAPPPVVNCQPPPPGKDKGSPDELTPPPKEKPPGPKPNTPKALIRIQFGSAGCTGTFVAHAVTKDGEITVRRPDGKMWVLTAAHCIKGVGQHGTGRLLDGRTCGLVVASLDRTSDVAWLVTEDNGQEYPFAILAQSSAPAGTKVWHAGYGIHVPGNREEGYVEAGPDRNGQCRYHLSVSNGDSGGGICVNEKNEVLSPVCCTSRLAAPGSVWGASPESCWRLRPTAMVLDDWTPLAIPLRPAPVDVPSPMPRERP